MPDGLASDLLRGIQQIRLSSSASSTITLQARLGQVASLIATAVVELHSASNGDTSEEGACHAPASPGVGYRSQSCCLLYVVSLGGSSRVVRGSTVFSTFRPFSRHFDRFLDISTVFSTF